MVFAGFVICYNFPGESVGDVKLLLSAY